MPRGPSPHAAARSPLSRVLAPSEVEGRVGEAGLAVRAAEVVGLAIPLESVPGGRHVDVHSANGVDRRGLGSGNWGRGDTRARVRLPALRVAPLHDLGENAERD